MPDITINAAGDDVDVIVDVNETALTFTITPGERVIEALYGIYPLNTYLEAAAIEIPADVVLIESDRNSRPGIFKRNLSYQVMIEGADGVTDQLGNVFKRLTIE